MPTNEIVLKDPKEFTFDNVRNMEFARKTPRYESMLASVSASGIHTPVEFYMKDGKPMIWDGQTRVDIAIVLGIKRIEAIEREPPSAEDLIHYQLVVNTQRQELNPLDKAKAFNRLTQLGVTQKDIAKRHGYCAGYISMHLSLLSLPPNLLNRLESGKIGYRAAYELSTLRPHELAHHSLEGITTHRQALATKRTIEAARDERQLEVPNFDPEEVDENAVMVFSLFDMGIRAIQQAMKLAQEHGVPADEQIAHVKEAIGD